MVKAAELRDISLEELEANLESEQVNLFQLINENKVNKKLDKPHRIKQTKKDIARYHTVIREKQITPGKE